MTEYSKYNVIYRLQKWLDSVPGQTFMNYAYSWGASIVIAGTLFKLTHLPGANFMLFLGMGTEVFVFFISAFDRPFDKTADGKDLPTHVREGELDEDEYENDMEDQEVENASAQPACQPTVAGVQGGGTIIIGGGVPVSGAASAAYSSTEVSESAESSNPSENPTVSGQSAAAVVTPQWVAQQQTVSPEMAEATEHYVEELNKLTEMLAKVATQSERLTRDSEEMENLNRTLTGITKVYEMQLKSASQQMGTIDQINEQSRKMAGQIEQLNAIYTRMIEAMTVNMRAATPGTTQNL